MKPGITVLAVFHLSARGRRNAGISGMLRVERYPGCGPIGGTVLHILDHGCASVCPAQHQRSDEQRREDSAQHASTIGETSRVTRCLSDLSLFLTGRSGVTLRREDLTTVTLLRSLRGKEALYPGVSLLLSPGCSPRTPHRDLEDAV